MPPKKARITVSDVPAWQHSVAGFLPRMETDICQTDRTVVCTSSTCSSSDADAHVTGNDDHDNPSAKKVRV